MAIIIDDTPDYLTPKQKKRREIENVIIGAVLTGVTLFLVMLLIMDLVTRIFF